MVISKVVDDHSLTDPRLLEKIDKFFACNVGEYVHLPQLVVVGDQSSGKSSVLEGLTGVPFPRGKDTCTRFATQISFRRDPVKKVNVTIIPGPSASEQHKAAVRDFTKNDLKLHDAMAFAQLMKEVKIVMGISAPEHKYRRKTESDSGVDVGSESGSEYETKTVTTGLSDDVLRLEVCGPQEEHFTVLDVPGIFKATTPGETTATDIEMARKMVTGYMQNPKSLILMVVQACIEMANQEIIEMAKEYDPQGIRTLGVFTKPDSTRLETEQRVLDTLDGKSRRLALGWHIVRNPGQEVLDNPDAYEDRHVMEKTFFETRTPWSSLNKDKVGIGRLRIKLQEVLASHVRREFPKVKSEINKRLQDRRRELDILGTTRETPAEQRTYLLEMCTEFQRLVDLAVSARYGSSNVFETHPELRLATAVVSEDQNFSNHVAEGGHSFHFERHETIKDIGKYTANRKYVEAKLLRSYEIAPELLGIAPISVPIKAPEDNILAWLKDVFETSRGFELASFDPALLAVTMRKQSANWEPLAYRYITDVASMIQYFIKDLLAVVCSDEQVRSALLAALNDLLLEQYRRAFDHVKFVLSVERDNIPYTLNYLFNENLSQTLQRRFLNGAKERSFPLTDSRQAIPLDDIPQPYASVTGDDTTIREIHDILRNYYEIARTRFVDTICMQGAAYHLVTGPDTPLKLFSARFVGGLTEDQLQDLAGEDALVRARRATLRKEIADLEAGSKIIV